MHPFIYRKYRDDISPASHRSQLLFQWYDSSFLFFSNNFFDVAEGNQSATLLTQAITEGDVGAVTQLLSDPRVLINLPRSGNPVTPILWAVCDPSSLLLFFFIFIFPFSLFMSLFVSLFLFLVSCFLFLFFFSFFSLVKLSFSNSLRTGVTDTIEKP